MTKLTAVAWMDYSVLTPSEFTLHKVIAKPMESDYAAGFRCDPLVRLSDAEAIIAEKDAEIEGWKFDLADALDMKAGKGPTVLNWQAERIKEQSAALKLARDALERFGGFRGVNQALAAIDALKGE